MITPELVKTQIINYFEPTKNHIEITYLKNINKIFSTYLLTKNGLNLADPVNILVSFELDKKLQIDLDKERVQKEKAIDFYYFKAIEKIYGLLRKLDYEYSYQMEVQRAFSVSSPLSLYNCKNGAIYYK